MIFICDSDILSQNSSNIWHHIHCRDNFNADEYFFGGRRPPRVHQQVEIQVIPRSRALTYFSPLVFTPPFASLWNVHILFVCEELLTKHNKVWQTTDLLHNQTRWTLLAKSFGVRIQGDPKSLSQILAHHFMTKGYLYLGFKTAIMHTVNMMPPQYIGFAEDMMLILFLVCILATLVTVHRATCYRQFQVRIII